MLEPMVGKFVLPLLGSAPEVWPTTVLFFQAALLAGYAFAHVTSRLPPRRQALLQLVLLGVAAVVLPIGVPDQSPPESGSPVPWLRPVVPRFVHHESRRKGGFDACSRAEARARGVRLTPLDRHTSPNDRYGTPPRSSAAKSLLRTRGVTVGVPLPGSRCGAGNGRTIA